MESSLFPNDSELMYINPMPDSIINCNASFPMTPDTIYAVPTHSKEIDCFAFDNDDCLVAAPPPSPQEPSMLDAVFEQQLQRSLEAERRLQPSESPDTDSPVKACARWRRSSTLVLEHAQTLDRLLRKTQQENKHIQKTRRPSRLKTKSLGNRTPSDLADAIALIHLSNELLLPQSP